MIGRAKAKFVRVSPRKVRQVLDIVRGRLVEEAFDILLTVKKGAAFYITQALKSAFDSAVKKTNNSGDASNLFISKAIADCGPSFKRYRAGSMGRAMPIRKRTSHITIELDMAEKPATSNQRLKEQKKEDKRKGMLNIKQKVKHGA